MNIGKPPLPCVSFFSETEVLSEYSLYKTIFCPMIPLGIGNVTPTAAPVAVLGRVPCPAVSAILSLIHQQHFEGATRMLLYCLDNVPNFDINHKNPRCGCLLIFAALVLFRRSPGYGRTHLTGPSRGYNSSRMALLLRLRNESTPELLAVEPYLNPDFSAVPSSPKYYDTTDIFSFIQLVLSRGGDINSKSTKKKQFSLLHIAVISRQHVIAQWLIHQGIDPYLKDAKGNIALYYACAIGDHPMVDILSKVSDPNTKNNRGLPAFHGLCMNSYSPMSIQILLAMASDTRVDISVLRKVNQNRFGIKACVKSPPHSILLWIPQVLRKEIFNRWVSKFLFIFTSTESTWNQILLPELRHYIAMLLVPHVMWEDMEANHVSHEPVGFRSWKRMLKNK